MREGDSILLKGLDGSNPLAFLAALGTLRTLTLALPDETVKMSWEQYDGAWRPRVQCSLVSDGDVLIEIVHDFLRTASNRAAFGIGDNLNLQAHELRPHLIASIENAESFSNLNARIDSDFFAGFGSEVVTNDDGSMQDTALRTMSGAGHQNFLKCFRELVLRTDANQLRRTLFLKWDYADEGRNANLRWDPLDDRRYALRWENPSTDPNKTMRGANRLAMEALPMFPTMPIYGRLATTAFQGSGARGTFFIWPIWHVPLNMSVSASLLSRSDELAKDFGVRASIGVAALFTSARITTGKFRNFTPSMPC